MYSDMSMRIIASLRVEHELRQRARELGLADARRAEEQERADRAIGVLQAGLRAAQRVRHGHDGLVLADDAPVQALLHPHELLDLALEHAADRDVRPARDDLGDVLGRDLLLEEVAVGIRPGLGGRQRLLKLGDLAVAQLGGALQVGLALGALGLAVRRRELLLEVAHGRDLRLLVLPLGLHPGAALLQLGELALEHGAAVLGGSVLLLAQRRQLDLELHRAAVELLDLLGDGVDLDPQPGGGLVDEVDRLVGQEAIGDVAVAERRGGDRRGVLDAHAVVLLVALLEPAQDRDGVLDRRLADHHRLEAPLQRGVLLDVLAVLVERRRADGAQLAAGEHRLEQVRGVDRALRGARADDRVQLVEEQHDLAASLRDLLEHGLQALLELAAVLGAREQRADVQRDDAPVAQRLGDVVIDDPLGEALDDRGLADAGLADEDGVVLRAPAEHLDDAADLLVAADDRVEQVLARGVGEVAAELLERLELVLGVLVGDAVRAAHVGERLQQALARRAGGAQRLAGGAVVAGDREQQVLDGDVVVLELAHLALGAAQHGHDLGRRRRLGLARQRGQGVERGVHVGAQRVGHRAQLAQDGCDDAAILLLQQHGEQVFGGDLRVAPARGQREGCLDGLRGLDREAVSLHGSECRRLRFHISRVDRRRR